MNWTHFKDPAYHMSCRHSGNILVSNTRGGRFEPFTVMINIFVTEFVEFIENI